MTLTPEANAASDQPPAPQKITPAGPPAAGHSRGMPDTLPPEISPAELRFQFLFPASQVIRFALYAPDVLDLRWACFDRVERITIGYGTTPEDAVDQAILTHSKSQ
jgi:hypothetical protein